MTDHMSAKDYQRLIVNKEKDDGAMSDEEFQKALHGIKNIAGVPTKKVKLKDLDQMSSDGYSTTFSGDSMKGKGFAGPKVRNHEEDDITKQVAEYLEVLQLQKKVVLFSHIPQETFTKSWVTKNKNKAMGVRAGVPDMVIVFPGKVLFLELKRLKGGKVSDAQKAWIEAINDVAYRNGSSYDSVVARVACGFVEAKAIIDSYS